MKFFCKLCKVKAFFFLNKDGFDLYKCNNCDLVFMNKKPSSDFLKNKLYSYESGYQANRVGDLSKTKESIRVRRVLNYFNKIKPGGNILDVGCAHGQFLYWSKKRGFNPVGVELNKRTADSAKEQGFNVYNGFVEEANFKKNYFDFIFLGEIIEHVLDPRDFIKECSKFLKQGGMIAITTPNIDCFWSKATLILYNIFGIPWSSVTPPYHIFQFNSKNLDLLMSHSNFKLAYESFVSMTRLKYELGMMHLLRRYKKTKKISDMLFMFFSYFLYLFIYIVNILINIFLKKEFNMIKIYKKI